MKRGLLLLVLIAAGGLIGSAPVGASSAVLVVDDDGAQCPNAAYTDIASAIAAANPGDTVLVCPGTYDETPTIDKQLNLRGYTPDLSSSSKCTDRTDYPADSPLTNSIVTGFVVGADHVTIRGFTVQGDTFTESTGVAIPGSVGFAWVTRNVIQDQTIGINLNGHTSQVDRNCIRDNNTPGSATGTGIYSDQGLVATQILNNAFTDNTGAGITLVGDGAGNLDSVIVSGNTSAVGGSGATGDGDLISISGATHSTISKNTATGTTGSAIYVQSANHFLSIDKNTLLSGEDEGIAIDASDDSPTTGTPSDNLSVTRNTVTFGATDNTDAGIALYPTSVDDSTFSSNTVTKNGYDGFFVDTGNSGNLITGNKLKGNQTIGTFGSYWDCHDETGGANTWTKDQGKTENVDGLCKGAKVTP